MSSTRHAARGLALLAVLSLLAILGLVAILAGPAALGMAASPPATVLTMPAMNVPAGGIVVSDHVLAYTLPDPLLHANNPNAPFTGFHNGVFVTSLRQDGGRLVASPPHLLFTGPRGALVALWSVGNDWLVYTQYAASDPAGPWMLAARNLATGRVVTLDTPVAEGMPSLAAQAASDGHTVVWQSWTQRQGQATSVIRAYNLDTGQRRLLAAGGTPTTWSYTWPSVAGHNVIFERDAPDSTSPRAQILLADLDTGHIRPLTPEQAANSEPSIAGDIAEWKQGWRYGNGRGIAIYNLQTGAYHSIAIPNVEQPKITTGGSIVFAAGLPLRVQAYDVRTGARMVVAGPQQDGYQPGNIVVAGGHMAVSTLGKLTDTATPSPTRLVVTLLP